MIPTNTNSFKILILTGFMGSGKTSIGKKISSELNIDFIDLDDIIVSKSNMSIECFFEFHGEQEFRKFESQLLRNLNFKKNTILALGGGTPIFNNNIDLLKSIGTLIYLKTSNDILFQRLIINKIDRPLISKLNDKELKDFINKEIIRREKYYLEADFIFNSNQSVTLYDFIFNFFS